MRHESCARIAALGRTEGELPVRGGGARLQDRRAGLVVRQQTRQEQQERGAAVQRGVPHSGQDARVQRRQGRRRARPALRRSGGERLRVTEGTVPLHGGGCGAQRHGDEPLESDSLRITDQ